MQRIFDLQHRLTGAYRSGDAGAALVEVDHEASTADDE
jgi:hypothetical protein